MAILDRFRSWLGIEVRSLDRNIQTDTENAADYLKQRTALHVANLHRDVEDFLDSMIAGQASQEAKPLTFEPLPALATLAAPAKQEPKAPAPEMPAQLEASEPPAETAPPSPEELDHDPVTGEVYPQSPASFKMPTGRLRTAAKRKKA